MKKMSPIFFSSVEKSNDGNHLKRVFPNSQANRSHPRRVNSRSKFGFFSCFFNFGFSAILWPPSVVRSWNFDSRRISSSRTSRNFFCRGRRWRKIENLRKTSRKILKKSRKTTKKTFHKNTNKKMKNKKMRFIFGMGQAHRLVKLSLRLILTLAVPRFLWKVTFT